MCVSVPFCGPASEQTFFFFGTVEVGAPNSVAAKVQSAAVPVNDVREERGADKDSHSSARRHELTFDAHVRAHTHTHTQTHQD